MKYKNYYMLIVLSALLNNFIFGHEDFITSIHVTTKRVDIKINDGFKNRYLKNDFFVEYEDGDVDLTKLDYSIVTMPCFMNVITLIWASGEKYYIDSMDTELFLSLKTIKSVFEKLYSSTKWDGDLIPRNLVDNKSKFLAKKKTDSDIALLFSHGLDSITTSFRKFDKNQLLITAWGHSDCPLWKKDLWSDLKKMIVGFGKKFGHANTFLKSNYHNFVNFGYLDKNITPEITLWRIEAVEGLGWAGLVAPILLSKGYTQFYIASSYCWSNPYPQAASPIVDDNIKFAGVSVTHDGFELARAEKNEYIARECKKRNINNLFMRVCVRTSGDVRASCGKCEKCLRTIAGFLILKEDLHKYGFKGTVKESMQELKNLFEHLKSRKLADRISYYWRELQDLARKELSKSHGEHRKFLLWFISQNIDDMTKFRPVQLIDWKEYTEFYSAIPQEFLK